MNKSSDLSADQYRVYGNALLKPKRSLSAYKLSEPVIVLALCCVIAAVWLTKEQNWSPKSWTYPPGYRGDSLYELGIIRAASRGWYLPLHWKMVPALGAPGVANWNDYPHTEDIHYFTFGLLARIFGLMPAADLALLTAYLLNGISFYAACRLLRYRRIWAATFAIVFAFSHYAAARAFGHLELIFYGHIPLALVVTWWVQSGVLREWRQPKTIFATVIVVWSGFQNAYYTYILGQLLAFAILVSLVKARSDRRYLRSVTIGCALLLAMGTAFFLGNIDTFSYWVAHGPNPSAVARNYAGVEQYALKPIELLLPSWNGHWLYSLGRRYREEALVIGESWTPYLGIVAIVALATLFVFTFIRTARSPERQARLPNGTWQLVWVFFLSVVGGANSIAALCGLDVFRATNRYSIVILAIVLLFAVRAMSVASRQLTVAARIMTGVAVAAVGIVDQMHSKDLSRIQMNRAEVDSDRSFVAALERELSPNAAIFQFPVAVYPEQGTIAKMVDYEHLRPFLYADSLRFSYGDDKGRASSRWQTSIESMSASDAIQRLRGKGFAAVIVDREGYSDSGAQRIEQFVRAGAQIIADAPRHDFVALKLP